MTVKLEDAGLDRFKRVSEIANMAPAYCEENSTIAEVVERMVSTGHRRMPIVDRKRRLVGVLTTSDVLDAFFKRENFKEKVSVMMVRDVVFCEADDTLDFVLQKFKLSRRGGFPILDDEKRLVGAISERDFVKRFSDVCFNVRVEECMTRKPLYISPNMSIMDCLKALVNTHYRRLPVVDQGKLVGITTTADVIKYIHKSNYNLDAMDESMEPVMTRDVCTMDKDLDVSEAIRLMRARDVGGVLVVEDGRLEGIITERDILEEIE
jgi:CBS domain-containing protein